MEENLKSWEEFEASLQKLRNEYEKNNQKAFLFRGQSNSDWPLRTTLERHLNKQIGVLDYFHAINRIKSEVESFTNKTWKIPTISEYAKHVTDDPFLWRSPLAYDYMVHLRHHGFPSPLLDWTQSPYVAAFFAFQKANENTQNISIYIYKEMLDHGKIASSGEPVISGYGPYVSSHPRHFRQQCEYTVCVRLNDDPNRPVLFYASHEDVFSQRNTTQDLLWKFNIPSSESRKVLEKLNEYNLNAYSLFGSEESLMETMAFKELR